VIDDFISDQHKQLGLLKFFVKVKDVLKQVKKNSNLLVFVRLKKSAVERVFFLIKKLVY